MRWFTIVLVIFFLISCKSHDLLEVYEENHVIEVKQKEKIPLVGNQSNFALTSRKVVHNQNNNDFDVSQLVVSGIWDSIEYPTVNFDQLGKQNLVFKVLKNSDYHEYNIEIELFDLNPSKAELASTTQLEVIEEPVLTVDDLKVENESFPATEVNPSQSSESNDTQLVIENGAQTDPEVAFEPVPAVVCPNAYHDEMMPCDWIPVNMVPKDAYGNPVPKFYNKQEAWDWGEVKIMGNLLNDSELTGFTLMRGFENNGLEFWYAWLKPIK